MVKHTEAYSGLVKRIQAVIDRHDPYSLLAHGAPLDEFERLAYAIARRVGECTDAAACRVVIWEEFAASYQEPGDQSSYSQLTEEIFAVSKEQTS